jgi:tetratricopeptide (TPR) repeat protein
LPADTYGLVMSARNALFVGVAAVLALAAEPPARGAAPIDPEAVVATVPARASREGRQLEALERDPSAKLELARAYLMASRRDGDPRYLGLAEGALQGLDASTDVRVLRATILQSRHEFSAALAELDAVLRDAEDAQARLTQATILTVLADYERARTSCRALPPSVYATVCLASIDALHGTDTRPLLEHAPRSAWTLSLIGEQSYWLGEHARAERELQASLALEDDRYTRALLDDLRLDRGEAADGDDLHQALSELARGEPGEAAARVEQGFVDSRGVHQREESRFWLARGERQRALQLAQRNWKVQREPWDARVLLEAASTREQAAPALAWLERTQFASPLLRVLAGRLK